MPDSEKNPQPLYKKLYEQFVRALHRGEFMPGTPFMSLSEFSSRYGVSEITARRVVCDLVAAGYLDCARGRRPRVAARPALREREYHVALLGRPFHPGDVYIRGPWSYHQQQTLLLEMLGARLIPVFCETCDSEFASPKQFPDCDALLLYRSPQPTDQGWLRKLGKPYLFLNSFNADAPMENLLALDYTPGGRAAALDLLADGVRSVLSLPAWKSPAPEAAKRPDRFDEFYRLLLESGQVAPADLVVKSQSWDGNNTSALEEAVPFLRVGHPRPIAFMVNDFQTHELGEYCRAQHWRTGVDFRIIGYTGMPEGVLARPAVSGLVMPFEAMARRATEYLRNAIEGREPVAVPAQYFPVHFAKRDT